MQVRAKSSEFFIINRNGHKTYTPVYALTFSLLNDEPLLLPLFLPSFFDWYEFCWSSTIGDAGNA
jgi:hypothetical protein